MRTQLSEQKLLGSSEDKLFEILTGKIRFLANPFLQEDTNPQLVVKITIPTKQHIPRTQKVTLKQFMNDPPSELLDAYWRAEEEVVRQMEAVKDDCRKDKPMIRLQTNLGEVEDEQLRTTSFLNEYQERENLEFDCAHGVAGQLDLFSMQFNAFMYTLQHICGFRAKAFILSDEDLTDSHIYVLLTLSQDNLMRVASKYRIKKQVDYAAIDFFLNQAVSDDHRPLKMHSVMKNNPEQKQVLKRINRYFNLPGKYDPTITAVEQAQLPFEEIMQFDNYSQEVQRVFDHYKHTQQELSPYEKKYIFDVNRRKLNPGCQKIYKRMKKRRNYFQLHKQMAKRNGYPVHHQPIVFQQFTVPNKSSKSSNFFQKLESLLLYRPQIVTGGGDMQLFLNMEKTKLSFLIFKSTFKVSYLSKIGYQVFALDHQFEKFGSKRSKLEYKGGLDGKRLEKQWPSHSFFADLRSIRNYMGEKVAHQLLIKFQGMSFMAIVAIPFLILFVLEQIFGGTINQPTSFLQVFLYAISFRLFVSSWQRSETQHISNYCDAVSSEIFLSNHRGPYRRNLVDDQPNEFKATRGVARVLSNFICLLLLVTVLVALGGVFHGVRMFLVQIYAPLSFLVFGRYISVPHIIAYSFFFSIEAFFTEFLVPPFCSGLLWIKNSPSDAYKWELKYFFRFLLAVGIELLGPFFFLILEPFTRTNCYADSCNSELVFYISSRFLIILVVSSIRLSQLLIFNYLKQKVMQEDSNNEKSPLFQQRLKEVLQNCVEQSKKPEHEDKIIADVININAFAMYCMLVPATPVIVFNLFFMETFSMRLALLYEERRPLNRSHRIISFVDTLRYVYFIGLFVSSWSIFFSLEFAIKTWHPLVQQMVIPIDQSGIFMFNFICSVFLGLTALIVSILVDLVASNFTDNALLKRKNNKFDDYRMSKGQMKIRLKKLQQRLPVQSIFRTFGQQKGNYEQVQEQIYGFAESEIAIGETSMNHLKTKTSLS